MNKPVPMGAVHTVRFLNMLAGFAHAAGGAMQCTTVKNTVSETDCVSFLYTKWCQPSVGIRLAKAAAITLACL